MLAARQKRSLQVTNVMAMEADNLMYRMLSGRKRVSDVFLEQICLADRQVVYFSDIADTDLSVTSQAF